MRLVLPKCTLEKPPAIFQTVSEGKFCELRPEGVLGSPYGPGPLPWEVPGTLLGLAGGPVAGFPAFSVAQVVGDPVGRPLLFVGDVGYGDPLLPERLPGGLGVPAAALPRGLCLVV